MIKKSTDSHLVRADLIAVLEAEQVQLQHGGKAGEVRALRGGLQAVALGIVLVVPIHLFFLQQTPPFPRGDLLDLNTVAPAKTKGYSHADRTSVSLSNES